MNGIIHGFITLILVVTGNIKRTTEGIYTPPLNVSNLNRIGYIS